MWSSFATEVVCVNALATVSLGEHWTCRASTAYEEVFAAIKVRDYNRCGRRMIPHETIHGPGDTIVTTSFARSEVTQVFGKRFLRWNFAPESWSTVDYFAYARQRNMTKRRQNLAESYRSPFGVFEVVLQHIVLMETERRHSYRSRGAEEERHRLCGDLGGAECVAEVLRTKVTWHCALALVADALRMDLQTEVPAWSRPEHCMRRVATKTSGTCAPRDGVHVSMVASFLAELWDTRENPLLCIVLVVSKLY